MTSKRYQRSDLDAILEPPQLLTSRRGLFGQLKDEDLGPIIDGAGLWPTAEFRWIPARELPRSVDRPRLSETPALPFPFDAADLAAFFLDGIGSCVREFYSDSWELNEQAFYEIPTNQDYARDAVNEAFDLLRKAVAEFGAAPDSNSDGPEWAAWRRAVVRQLLVVAPSAETNLGVTPADLSIDDLPVAQRGLTTRAC